MKQYTLILIGFFLSLPALADDGVLHTFYAFELKTQGRIVDTLKHSEDVVVENPINIDFKDRCKISLLFSSKPNDQYQLILTIKEQTSITTDTFAIPVDYTYVLALDESLKFTIQTEQGLIVTGELNLTRVNRIELAS